MGFFSNFGLMSLRNGFKQVIIGPLNSVDNAHSVGAVDGINFIGCAVGGDVFILSTAFEQIQTISQNDVGFGPVTAINCCMESGRIAICHNVKLRVFEPNLRQQMNGEKTIFPYQWFQSQSWHLDTDVENVQWILGGFRLLVFAGKDLLLYQHKMLSCAVGVEKKARSGVKFTLNSDDENVWEIAWTTQLASRVKYVRVSSDGALFATCGHGDAFVKIWYQLKDSNCFSFLYLQHPSPVYGFEWRHSGGYFMPKRWAQNALITWCEDKTARIWKETPSRDAHLELSFIGTIDKVVAVQQGKEQQQTDKLKKQPKMGAQMKRAKGRLMHKLGQVINEKRKVSTGAEGIPCPTGQASEMLRSPTFADFSITPFTSGDTLAFNLVATINAENDCFLVPSLDGSMPNNEKKKSPRIFSVHWLNNKEHCFILNTLQILMDALPLSGSEHGIKDLQAFHSLHSSTSSAGIAANAADLLDVSSHHHPPHSVTSPNLSKTIASINEEAPSAKDLLDYKLEMLLRQWNKSSDILFAIHPLDGSLMTWTLEWLDDAWKQPTVSFASRLPDAFPLADVASMSIWLHIWHPSSQYGFNALAFSQHHKWNSDEEGHQQNPFEHFHTNNLGMSERDDVCLLTRHPDTHSLDLWIFQMDEQSDRTFQFFGGGRRTEHPLSVPFSIASVLHELRLSEEQKSDGNTLLEVLNNESLFDASALVNPLLPQYHPIQLVGLLNSGRIQRVKAILLNILRSLCQRQQGTSPLFKMAKPKTARQSQKTIERNWDSMDDAQLRKNSISMRPSVEAEGALDYDELAAVNPLPLYALLASDNATEKTTRVKSDVQSSKGSATDEVTGKGQNAIGTYDALFTSQYVEDELDLDSADVESFSLSSRKQSVSRTRKISSGSLEIRAFASSNPSAPPPTNLTSKHSRLLTEMLTHIHLPGLSSVDQMHLLAVADTISHFSTNSVVDRLAQANAELQPIVDRSSSLGDSAASGYAISGSGIETVDECGLRFLMAKKQHEYLLRCLPIKQRRALKAKGISSAYVIWAFHSNTEVELLNSIPCCQRQEESWDELRSYGIAWWLKNNAILRNCMERVAKNTFQKRQEPMDAALFYLAMRKKNVLTQLFKTVNDGRMYQFFREDFTLEKWKKGALKNAFVLMSKQRFQHAAAFFLLAGSLKDAVQIILNRIGDLQLAMVVLRFYESDPERQFALLTELLCREVFGCEPAQFHLLVKDERGKPHFPSASRDPFERSMALWLMNEYALSAATLLEEPLIAQNEGKDEERRGSLMKDANSFAEVAMPDIFNFYSFLRRHPLVIRQKLANSGISTKSTEQFLTWTHRIGAKLSAGERQLYLRTASFHLTAGCPLLALDVLSRMPAQIDLEQDDNGKMATDFLEETKEDKVKGKEEIDWSLPVDKLGMDSDDKLELKWSDEEEGGDKGKDFVTDKSDFVPNPADDESKAKNICPVDVAAQNMKLLATLSIITDELNTLVVGGGYEVAGGQLRLELFSWLERECAILHKICDIQGDAPVNFDAVDTLFVSPSADDECSSTCSAPISSSSSMVDEVKRQQQSDDATDAVEVLPLHEAIRQDRNELRERVRLTLRRRNWLRRHRRLLFTLAAYCALQSAKNSRLIAVQMELLLLLLEVHQNESTMDTQFSHSDTPLPGIHSFPLLVSSISSSNSSASHLTSPLRFMMDQYVTLIQTINELNRPPQIDSEKAKFQNLFSLCQVLSLCVYQSLSDVEDLAKKSLSTFSGPLTLTLRRHSNAGGKVPTDGGDVPVVTLPSHWPGVNSLIALLSRERIRSEKVPPNLRLLLVEFFVAIVMSIFCHAFAFYDSQWLFRVCAHPMDVAMFSLLFGGGGERRLRSAVPARPPPPMRGGSNLTEQETPQVSSTKSVEPQDEAAIRAKLHAKVFRIETPSSKANVSASAGRQQHSEQIIQCWVPPKKHIVQYFAEKVTIDEEMVHQRRMDDCYNSDDETPPENESELCRDQPNYLDDELSELRRDNGVGRDGEKEVHAHEETNGYAWTLMRLAIVRHIQHKLRNFVEMVGFDLQEIAHLSPKLNLTLKRLNSWASQLEDELEGWKDGCPSDFLPNMSPVPDGVDSASLSSSFTSASWSSPLLHKYRFLLEPGNSPFEYVAPGVRAVRRLWNFLVLQENLAPIFVRYSFAKRKEKIAASVTKSADLNSILSVIKLVHREHDPIVAFAVNSMRPGFMAVSTGRELQELSIDRVLDEHERVVSRLQHYPSTSSFLLAQNWAELDISMQQIRRDPLRDNDDYQLLIPGSDSQPGKHIPTQTSAHLRKRLISGVRRLEAHSSLPYYASGSSDGSVFLWEWGVEQPVFVARVAGQFAKVAKLAFAQNGARFAAVDGDGLLSIWQAQPGIPTKKPNFMQKCHNKFASDVKFLGQTSTLLVTAGLGLSDQNITLWDILMPQSKSAVHSFVGHPDGAFCVAYQSNTQSLISGGKHGEICIWDVRQRQLRVTLRAFDNAGASVRCVCLDPSGDIIAAGSSEGDIKVWSSASVVPQLLYSLPTEHAARSGFSLRQVASVSLQGVQQINIDSRMNMCSCGADNSLKLRIIPNFSTSVL